MIKPRISKPNTKTNIESFNINNTLCRSIKGCITQDCFKHCYYNKIKRIYPQQEAFLNDNIEASKSDNFVMHMNNLINSLNIRYFRIHSVGEFYSQAYFNKWVTIARANKDIIFFTYTKNINLNVKRPKNFILFISDDLNTWQRHYKRFDGVSRIKERYQEIPKGFSLCSNQLPQGLTCVECKKCLTKGLKVCFNKH